MSGITTEVAELLKQEVSTLVEDLSSYLFNEPLERTPLFEGIYKLQGICRMLELSSLGNLLDELHKVIKMKLDAGDNLTAVQAELSSVLDIFPNYFSVIPELSADIPFLFMPELAMLRKLQGQPPMYEFQVLKNHSWPESSHFSGSTELGEDALVALKKLKQVYQMGLLDVLRGTNQQKGAETLAKVVAKLKVIFVSEAEKRYWSLVEAVASAMANGRLSFNPVRMRLLAAVERQLKTLLDNDGKKSAYPLGLWRAYAILLAMVADKDESAQELCRWLGAPEFDFVDRDLDEIREHLFGEQDAGFEPFLESLSAKLGSLHSLLERVDSEELLSPDESAAFATVLNELSISCAQHSLSRAADRFEKHHQSMASNAGQHWRPDSELLKETAHTILYLECLILQVRDQAMVMPSLLEKLDQREVDDIVEQNLVSSSMCALWDECLRKLDGAKTLLDDISNEMAGDEVSADLTEAFVEIQGAANMAGNPKVTDITKRCANFVRDRLFGDDEGASGRLASFADTVVALEHFFSDAVKGRQSDYVLDIAEDYLNGIEA